MLAAVYLAGVTAVGWIGRAVIRQSGTVAVTLSTLLVAASPAAADAHPGSGRARATPRGSGAAPGGER